MREITEAIVAWMQANIGNEYIATILLSMVPMIEVRGAITVGTGLGMNPWLAFVISCCSALIVCPFLLLLLKPILKALKKVKWFRSIASAVEDVFRGKAKKIDQDAQESIENASTVTVEKGKRKAAFNKSLGVFLFVAIPIPLTGVWTGSAVAAFLDLEYKYSVPAIVIGNFVAGLIITVLNIILAQYASIILLVLGIFMLISIASLFITVVAKHEKNKKIPPLDKEEENVTKDKQ